MILAAAVQWLVVAAFCALAGGPLMAALVRGDRLAPLAAATEAAQRRWLAGCVVTSVLAALAAALALPLDGRQGWVIAARLALLGVIGVLVRRNARPLPIAAAGLLLLLTQSLASRSAGLPDSLARVLADGFHFALSAAWLGGVAMLAAVFAPAVAADPALTESFSALVDRFSPLAVFCVLGLGLTGIVQASAFLGDVAELFTTPYGRALAAKLALFGGLVAFGAVHQQVVAPQLRRWRLKAAQDATARATRRFRASLLAEAAVSAALLATVGVMKATAIG